MNFYQMSPEQVLLNIDSDKKQGLSEKQVHERLLQYGFNTTEQHKKFSFLKTFFQQLCDPLVLLLACSGIIIFFAGDPFDAFIISGVIFLNASIGAFQEQRIVRMVLNLEQFKKLQSTVIRQGKQQLIFDQELVPGDILILQEGEHVPADARIVECYQVLVNESILTGESEPVAKQVLEINGLAALSEQNNMLFCGSSLVAGYARAVIVATGAYTENRKIQEKVEVFSTHMPLQKDLAAVLRFILWLIVFICVSLFLIGLVAGKPLPELFAALLALFMCVVPQGLPVIMTVILVAGAYAMARHKIVAKRLQAIEALGRSQVVIVDKTGTITKNELMVVSLVAGGREYVVTGSGYHKQGKIVGVESSVTQEQESFDCLRLMMEAALLLDRSVLEYNTEKKIFTVRGSTNEAALTVCAQKYGLTLQEVELAYKKLYEISFSSHHQYHVGFYQKDDQGILFALGSVEALSKRSKGINVVQKTQIDRLVKNGIRVLSVACKQFSLSDIPTDSAALPSFFESVFDQGLDHVGIFGIQDTLREHVSEVVMQMKNAGLQVIMATGDGAKTAAYMAHQAGILTGDQKIMEGSQMHTLSDNQMLEQLQETAVYARALPSDKLRLVSLFQSQGKVVMVIGDGVNDVPALCAAQVSVAMGATGTEIAKSVAHIIILDDAFEKIVEGIEYGRHIFYTFKRVILYFFTTNFAEVLVMLFTLAGGFPVPLLACQILWLNLVTDGFLDTALSLEPLESDLMHFSWMKQEGVLLTTALMWQVVSVALLVAFFSCLVFLWYLPAGLAYARTMTMVTLTCCQWVTALNCRSLKKSVFTLSLFSNGWLMVALVGIVVTQVALIYVPFLQVIFKTTALLASDWVVVIGVGMALLLVSEFRKSLKKAF